MEPEIQSKIEETVLQILKTSNIDETTKYKIRQKASEELGLDLSPPDRKKFVRKVVEAYLTGLKEEPEVDEGKNDAAEGEDEEEEEEGQGKRKRGGGAKEYDDNGDLILCKAIAKHGASSSRGLAKVVKTEKTSSPGAPRPSTTKTRTLQVMLHESDDEGGDKDLIHFPVMEPKDVRASRVEPSQNDVVEGLDSKEMDEIIVTEPRGDVFEKESDDFLRPGVAKVEVNQRSHIETMEEGTVGGEEPIVAEKHHSPVGVTVAGDPTVGNTTAAVGGDAAGDDDHVDTVFKEVCGTMVGASSGSEGPLVKPTAKIRAVSTKTMVSIGAVVGNAFVPVVNDRLLEAGGERFTDSFLETNPPQVHASLRVAIPSDYEEDDRPHLDVHVAPPRVISAFVEHTPSIDQQARHPPPVPCTSRRVVAEPAVLRNVDFEAFASISKSSPFKQAFQTLNEGVGNSLEELVVNQDGSRGSFGQQNPGEFLSSHFQSEIQDEKDQEEDALEDMPTEKMIAGVHIGVKYYPILEEVEQRCPNIFSNLFSVNPWLTYGILVGFANFLKEVRYARVDDFDASKMKTFLLALKEFEQMGLDASWIRLCFEEAQRHNNVRMFAQDLEVAQALILERERKLAELKADLARKKGELAKARRTPTSLAYGDLILKDLF